VRQGGGVSRSQQLVGAAVKYETPPAAAQLSPTCRQNIRGARGGCGNEGGGFKFTTPSFIHSFMLHLPCASTHDFDTRLAVAYQSPTRRWAN
jgi:hypothetical protein